MIGYKDMAFCPYLDCKNVTCARRLTDEVKNAARRWWGKDNPPIIYFAERPECFENSIRND